MKTIKVSDADGPALDWLVAKALNLQPYRDVTWKGGKRVYCVKTHEGYIWQPSTSWAQGGPIIDRLLLQKGLVLRGWLERSCCQASLDFPNRFSYGPTPLIAAMRCFIVAEFGDTAEVPEDLT